MKSHRPVELRVSAKGPFGKVPNIAVAGEISAWDMPLDVAVKLDDDGIARGSLTLMLPPGMYAYKLLVDGEWTIDDEALRTRSENKRRNHVLSVEGTPEPILFAPGAPWIAAMDRGGVRVVAALRFGHGDSVSVLWQEPADNGEHSTEMVRVAEEDEHCIFEARLPISSGKVRLRFELDDGRLIGDEQGGPIHWEAPPDTTPAWWHNAVVYTIFVDRFRPRVLHSKWARDPGPQKYAGGHLDGVTHALHMLAEMGVNVVYLTPIHEGANCHRYDIVDPFRVDPRLGGEPALQRLLEAAHALGMRIALDFTCSHAGTGFPPYEDVKQNGPASRYASWFLWTNDRTTLRHYGTRSDAPLFNLYDPEVRAYFIELVRRSAERGVDALRLDAAADVPFDLAREFRRVFRELRPDGVVFGEFVHLHAYRFIAEEAGDAATEFGFFDAVTPFLAYGAVDGAEVARRLRVIERERGAPAFRALRFLCTHDHPRLATLARLRGRMHVVPLGFLMLFTLPGIPVLLYGEELGLYADRPEQTIEHVWPDRMPMPWPADEAISETPLRDVITTLEALRRTTPALLEGELSFVHGEGGVLVYRREASGDVIDIALNTGPDELDVMLDDEAFPETELLFRVGRASLDGMRARLGMGAGVVVRRRVAQARHKLHIAGNAVLRDRDFVSSAQQVQSRPSRLDLAITERCNLRCAHCITHAPARTALREAREWSPWLLDRIRDDLAFAEHFAFVHGGESLVSPMLVPVLDAIRKARSGLSTMVHLLTNGVLLSAKIAEDLALRGVRSISVSLDGATAGVNDAIREGGRFHQVVENVREVVKLRNEKQLDLRLGISTVVLSQNVSELETLVDLCVELGIDWLKLEEVVPVNAFAAKSLVRLDGGFAADAVRAACARGISRGLVMVDHSIERPIWRCRLEGDPAGRMFLEADGFANRAVIHSCRAPWEIACIEANGDVRMGHFFGPMLGNVVEAPLMTLWNGPAAVDARRAAMASRLCKEGPVICSTMDGSGLSR
ncbi:MAG: radical SAM protein [Polyangiaceae bacterium]|nr:radical SAM protein [Polyangiaceae bacterium]